MPAAEAAYQSPYAVGSSGSSTPPPEVSPKEGWHELKAFFWLSLLNSLIIAVVGVVTWFLLH